MESVVCGGMSGIESELLGVAEDTGVPLSEVVRRYFLFERGDFRDVERLRRECFLLSGWMEGCCYDASYRV